MAENIEKKLLIKEARSICHGLSHSDRRLLRAYFSYIKVKQLPESPLKKPDQACQFVRSMLWPKKKKKKKEQGNLPRSHNQDHNGEIKEHPSLTTEGEKSLIGEGIKEKEKEKEKEEEEKEEEKEEKEKEKENYDENNGENHHKNDAENDIFDISILLEKNVPTVMDHDVDSITSQFREGGNFNDTMEIAVIRTYTSFTRIFENDISNQPNFQRILLIGPVRRERDRER